jgi:HK97 gp10 family phage protein
MADSITVQVQGLKEIQRKLIAMGPKVGLRALRGALVSGSQVIKKDAISRAPVDSGRLSRAILVKRLSKTNPFKEQVIVGVRNGKKLQKTDRDAYYWRFIEFGHKDKAGKAVAAQSFLRPAFEAKKMSALERIKEVLKNKIAQFAKERS